MNFIGVDLHKKSITVCVMDQNRKVLARKTINCDEPNQIVEFFRQFRPFKVVVEATASYLWFVELRGAPGRGGHPGQSQEAPRHRREHQEDRSPGRPDPGRVPGPGHDPPGLQPTPRQREHRALVRHRQYLQGRITSVRCKIHHILADYNADRKDLFSTDCGRLTSRRFPSATPTGS